ncbi:hypothetical protein L1987_23460 [Smallanthus sonchifolius]|uniref:Uncharacterized protein n=1 Tax=Smallanthus sonchifolius TaxID=185202 RepID=A0ACB9IJG6_9ASTR|nr:hypothetical protein L1987_23460 [Smallanthus sonchifolius]
MATVIQTIDVDIGTTNRPLRLQSTLEYRNWMQRMQNFLFVTNLNLWKSVVDGPSILMALQEELPFLKTRPDLLMQSEDLITQFNRFVRLVCKLKSADVELDSADIIKQFMTSLPHKWLVYTIPIRRTENLNTFTLEEVYETLQNYEFESKGFQETVVSKQVGAALIAPVTETMIESMEYPQA